MRPLIAIFALPLMAAVAQAQAPATAQAAMPTAAGTDSQPAALPEAQSTGKVLDLAQALKLAREHAPELRQAAAASEAARSRVGISRAPLLPQVIGTASYARGTFNSAGTFNAAGTFSGVVAQPTKDSFDTRDSWSFGMRVTQLIWDFGQAWNIKETARFTALAQEETEHESLLDISFNVRNAYLTAAANKALWAVSIATQKNQERHLDQIQGFVEVGTRPPIDLAQARTDVANAKLSVLRAENAYAGGKASLSRAMGVASGADYDVSTELPPAEEGESSDVEGLVERAEKERPDFAAIRDQVIAQETNLRSIKGQYGPSLNFIGSGDLTGLHLSSLPLNFSGGLTLTWPIFQGGLTNSRVGEGRALLTGLHAELDAIREDLRLALTQAVLSVKAAQAELLTAGDLVGLAQERLVLAEGRYQTGVGNTIELGDAELALRDAQTQQVTSEYDLAIARAQLRHSLGRL